MRDYAENILITNKTIIGLDHKNLEIINEIYDLGLTGSELQNTKDIINTFSLDKDKYDTRPIFYIVKKIENPVTSEIVYFGIYSAGSFSYKEVLFFIGSDYLPKDIDVSNYVLVFKKEQDSNSEIIPNKNFIFCYEPSEEEYTFCDRLRANGNQTDYKFKDTEDFSKQSRKSPEALKILLKGDGTKEEPYFLLDTISTIYEYFDKKFTSDTLPGKIFSNEGLPHYVNKMLEVTQVTPTQRLVLIARPQRRSWNYSYNNNYYANNYYNSNKTFPNDYGHDYNLHVSLIDSNDPQYDYCDQGRLFLPFSYADGQAGIKHPLPIKAFFLDVFSDDLPAETDAAPLKNFLRNRDDGVIINPERLQLLIKKYDHLQALKKQKQEVTMKVREKIIGRLDKVEIGEDTFKLNGVTYEQDKIIYENNILKFNCVKPTKVLNNVLHNFRPEIIDFDTILDSFVNRVMENTSTKEKSHGQIGSIEAEVEFKPSKNTRAFRTYVNGFRINNAELPDVLKRALCYTKKEQYEHYLKQVSKCSLRIYSYLINGLKLQVIDKILNKEFKIVLPLERLKNKKILKLGDRNFPISDINKFLFLEKVDTMDKVITRLNDNAIIKNITAKDIAFIIDEGIKAHKEAERKEKEMRKRMEKLFDVKENKVKFADGTIRQGYLVAGHFKTYFVSTADAQPFSYPDGNRICMITKHDVSTQYESNAVRIFERVMVLKNDSRVANRIETLEKYKQAVEKEKVE